MISLVAILLPGTKAPNYGWGCCFVFWHVNIELPRWVAVWVFVIGVETADCVIALTGNSCVFVARAFTPVTMERSPHPRTCGRLRPK